MPLVLLSYSVNTQALSATTAKAINGSKPYLTFDNGVTKATTSEGLLGITVSDGKTKTTYTPANNPSTAAKPIELPKENQSFADIGMLVPVTTNSIALSALIGPSYNYWGDDDGDGKGTNGVTATGSLRVNITDKDNLAVSRDTVLTICNAPYKVVLTSTDGSITTRYGIPNSSSFSGSTATYYINPKATPAICYARPSLQYGTKDLYIGQHTTWDSKKGFKAIGLTRNFPTAGANGLYFDLLAGGIDAATAATLTWPSVTDNYITATMTVNPPKDSYFNPDGASVVRVTLTGPTVTDAQQNTISPGRIDVPYGLPARFELVGYDSSHKPVLSYSFYLRQWFVVRSRGAIARHEGYMWCNSLGYRVPRVKDLTNAKCDEEWCGRNSGGGWQINGSDSVSWSNWYQRHIEGGLFGQWGDMNTYPDISTSYYYWTDYEYYSNWAGVKPSIGRVTGFDPDGYVSLPDSICVAP